MVHHGLGVVGRMVHHGLEWFIMVKNGFIMVQNGSSWFRLVHTWFIVVQNGSSWFGGIHHSKRGFINVYGLTCVDYAHSGRAERQ